MQRTRQDHVNMMAGQGPEWPWGFHLPLVKRDGSWDCGWLVAGEGPVVFVGNMFTGAPKEAKQYDSFEAIAADGWEVD